MPQVQSLSLRITVTELGVTKTLSFPSDATVHDACREIRSKFGPSAGGNDHSLYWPAIHKWLAPTKILDYYDLSINDELEFKKKHRQLKVKTLDGTVRTVLIDETCAVSTLVEVVCEKFAIQNPDEYSFLFDGASAMDSPTAGFGSTMTLNDKGPEKEKKKKKNDDEGSRWLSTDKTLCEQGIGEADMVTLKKKFFYSDQLVDRNDPVQVNLLYNQCKASIIEGQLPCTMDEAAQFAALQCQIQFGNHEPDKHKHGYIKTREFLPEEFAKSKEAEKKIWSEHRKLQGLTELNGKFRYVQLSRSLRTYGITFFKVKERVPKKSKLITVLLGVTRSSLMRVDADTKETLKEWKLTQLRRWAATPNNFTLDFGDYSNTFYSVQTKEGEAISQLISGYIDIILKRRKEADKAVEAVEEEQAVVEEYVKPGRATNVGNTTARQKQAFEMKVSSPAMMLDGNRTKPASQIYPMQFAGTYRPPQAIELSGAQQALLLSIGNGFAKVNAALSDLDSTIQLPPLGDDPASRKWKQDTTDVNAENIASLSAGHLAASASLINQLVGALDELDYDTLGANISTLSSNLGQISQAAKMISAIAGGTQDGILDAVRELARTTAKLLELAQPVLAGEDALARQDFYGAAREVALDVSDLLALIGRLDVSPNRQSDIMDAARAVVRAISELVGHCKNISNSMADPEMQEQIVLDARMCAEVAGQLVACTSAVVPTVNAQICFEQLMTAVVMMRDGLMCVAESSEPCQNQKFLQQLRDASNRVEEAIVRLVDLARNAEQEKLSDMDRLYDQVINAVDRLMDSKGDVEQLVAAAKELTMASTQFVNGIKVHVGTLKDDRERVRLVAAGRALAEITSKMVGSAKEAARNVNDADKQANLVAAVSDLKRATDAAAGPGVRGRTFEKLAKAVKDVVASDNQLCSAARLGSSSNRNQTSQLQLNQVVRAVSDATPTMVTALRMVTASPDDTVAQMKLLNAAKAFVSPTQQAVSAVKSAVSTINDMAVQAQLLNCAKQTSDAVARLLKCMTHAEDVSAGLELHGAISTIKVIQNELLEAKDNVRVLKPLKAQTADSIQADVASTVRAIQSTISQLAAAASEGHEKYTGVAATDAVASLQALALASKGLAATQLDNDFRSDILSAAVGVADGLSSLVSSARAAVDDPKARDEVSNVVKNAQESLLVILDALPGQRDLDRAMRTVEDSVQDFLAPTSSPILSTLKSESFQSAQTKLVSAGAALSVASNNLLTATRAGSTPQDLQTSAHAFEYAFQGVVEALGIFKHKTTDTSVVNALPSLIASLAENAVLLLTKAKQAALEPDNNLLRSDVLAAAKAISKSLNQILDICSVSAPGHSECNSALSNLTSLQSRLEETVDGLGSNRDSYGDALQKLSDQCKTAVQLITSLPQHARGGDHAKLAQESVPLSDTIAAITDTVVRCAYLVGVADPASIPATSSGVDQFFFANAGKQIHAACEKLANETVQTQQHIVECASTVARNTSALCNACKDTAQTNSAALTPMAKQKFVSAAKDIASRTSGFVASIKQFAINPRDPSVRTVCVDSSFPVLEAVDALVSYAVSPEFAGTKAKLSSPALEAQKLLLEGNKSLVTSAQNIVNAIKSLCANVEDNAVRQVLNAEVRAAQQAVADTLSAVCSAAPGQKECDEAIDKTTETVALVDSFIVEATIGGLKQEALPDRVALVDAMRAVVSLVEVAAKATIADQMQLGPSVSEIPDHLTKASRAILAVASHANGKEQRTILDDLKEFGDSVINFLWAAKNISSSASATTDVATAKLETEKAKVRTVVNKLIKAMEDSSDETGEFIMATELIEAFIGSIESRIPAAGTQQYQKLAGDIDKAGKQLVEAVGEAVAKAKTPQQYILLAKRISDLYGEIIKASCNAIADIKDPKVQVNLKDCVKELGGSSIKLVDSMRLMNSKVSGSDTVNKLRVTQSAREVSSHVANVISAAKDGSKGVLVCQESISHINDVMTDLESVMIFAEAGQLDPFQSSLSAFTSHKDAMLTSCKSLTESAKRFITSKLSNQEELASVATATVTAMQGLKEETKQAAIAITSADKHMQQQLLSSAKAVAEALQSLLAAAMTAAGKPGNDPAIQDVTDAVKAQFSSVADLIRVVKLLSDESSRGIRALDSSIKGIDQITATLVSAGPAQGTALPEEVAGLAKQLATASASVVAASHGKQDELVAAANAIRKQLEDLARAAKAAIERAPDSSKTAVAEAVRLAASSTQMLLAKVRAVQETNSIENKQGVQEAAKAVVNAVNEIVTSTNDLIPSGYADPNDPNVIAERELLKAANAIEAAAKRVGAVAPAATTTQSHAGEDEGPKWIGGEDFEGQVLDATKAIAAATAALVRSATAAQRDIVSKGRGKHVPGTPKPAAAILDSSAKKYFDDGTWNEGLVSAAKQVAAATQDLCEVAAEAAKAKAGKGPAVPRERIIVASRQVGAATTQLITAAQVSGDPNSSVQIRLRAAGKAVTGATEQLVRAAEEAIKFDDTETSSKIAPSSSAVTSPTNAKVLEMEAQMSVLKMEKELERARAKLASVRKGRYDVAKSKSSPTSTTSATSSIASPSGESPSK
ncbi:hypothetical protein BJ742DRAFT_115886 [Cladochytrium replicatum]|nr:hypothetical protein BJ742DRAFT_115886 [Cladochytrium replicatum]